MGYYLNNASLIGTGYRNTPLGLYDINYAFTASDEIFKIYTPESSDQYTLSNQLGAGVQGSYTLDSTFFRTIINGQNRGVLGTGVVASPPTTTNYQLLYAPNGGSAYTYGANDDAFQPGTPHESSFFAIDNDTVRVGGWNNLNDPLPGLQNGTVLAWKINLENTVIVLLGSTTTGHVIFQYKFYADTPRILYICHDYINTSSTNKTITLVRGGDVDFGGAATNNQRGVTVGGIAYSQNDYVSSTANDGSGRTLGIYCPGDGYTHNCSIVSNWSASSPTNVLVENNIITNASDHAIYAAWSMGTILPGARARAICYYLLGTSYQDAANQILLIRR